MAAAQHCNSSCGDDGQRRVEGEEGGGEGGGESVEDHKGMEE